MSVVADTNLLLRLVLREQTDEYAQAVALVTHLARLDDPLVVTEAVFVESFWVLERVRGVPREKTVAAMRDLLGARGVSPWDEPLSPAALDLLREQPRLDPVDAVLVARSRTRGDEVASFDSAVNEACGGRSVF